MHSLFTGFPQFAAILAVFFCAVAVGALISARRSANLARRCLEIARENTIEALSESKLAELERSLTELWDSHSSLLASHKRLRSKYGMRDLRERRRDNGEDQEGFDFPDDEAEKARYKAKLRRQCKERGLLK